MMGTSLLLIYCLYWLGLRNEGYCSIESNACDYGKFLYGNSSFGLAGDIIADLLPSCVGARYILLLWYGELGMVAL